MIKNIVFDFGDIFINLDKQGTYKVLANLGVSQVTQSMMENYYTYEKGLMSTKDFVNFYEAEFGIKKQDLINAWNAVLLDFPKRRLDFLQELAQQNKYRLFLLSNTNELHIESVKNTVGIDFFKAFKNSFEQFYLSHEIHFRKPDLEIYEFVLQQNNLIAEETLFVDDLKENTDAAKKLGIKVWNLNPQKEDVTELFTKTSLH